MSLNQLICHCGLICDSKSPSLESINAAGIANASSQLPGSQRKIELIGEMPLAFIILSESASTSMASGQSESSYSKGFKRAGEMS